MLALLATAAPVLPGHGQVRGTAVASTRLAAGRLLVARPGMADPNFAETVVLLLSHGDDGAMGVIVNRPTEIPLAEVLPEVERLAGRPEVVYRGGPVEVQRMLFVLRAAAPPEGCQPVLADVCAGGSLDLLQGALAAEPTAADFRGFAGYAGWTSGQLEWELEQLGWYVVRGDSRRVFESAADELWSALVEVAESPVA